jgi:hypothetical protein
MTNDEGMSDELKGRAGATSLNDASDDPIVDRWRAWALAEGTRRELPEMAAGLELVARAAARLRRADWIPDAARPGSASSPDDGRH